MSFDPPTIKGTISPYRSQVYQTFAEHAQEAIAAWILEQLKTKYPTHNSMGGPIPINYSYFFDLTPKAFQDMSLPAVAIDVVLAEYPTLGSVIGAGSGGYAAGMLRDVEIGLVIFGNSARLSASVDAAVSAQLVRLINHTPDIPIIFATKYHLADDRGFSSIDRFVMTSLWQNLPDEVFVKITWYKSAVVEEFIDDTIDNVWSGMVGGVAQEYDVDGDQSSGITPSHVTLTFKFTPTIP